MPQHGELLNPGEPTKFFEKALKKADSSNIGVIYFLHAFSASFWIDLVLVLGIMLVTNKFFTGDYKLDNASAMAGYTAFLTGAFSLIGRGGSYKKTDPTGPTSSTTTTTQKQETIS